MPRLKRDVSDLQAKLATKIIEYVKENGFEEHYHLVEDKLAQIFNVSRSPIRRTLEHLAREGVVNAAPNRGFFLARDASKIDPATIDIPEVDEDRLYSMIIEERMIGALGDLQTEVDLIRRYNVKRGTMTRVLWRLAKEDIIVRSPGVGWTFLPSIESLADHNESYRLRLLIEPACLIEPTFAVDPKMLAKVREAHEIMLRKPLHQLTGREIFEVNAGFHRMLGTFSGNRYFLQIIDHQNRLRRLQEYEVDDVGRIIESYQEHLAVMDAIEAGDLEWGASLLRRHLNNARRLATRCDDEVINP